jgi:hypothetical protein
VRQVLLLTALEVSKQSYFGPSNQIPYMQIATWNDYEEGTEIETGIDNCYSISASLNTETGTLSWTLNSSDLYGYADVNTIHHFTVWWGQNGNNPNKVLSVAATNIAGTQNSIELSQLSLPVPAPNYTVDLYVEIVGMPLILNKMSAAVPYTY